MNSLAVGAAHLAYAVAAGWWADWSAAAVVWELAAFAGKATLLLVLGLAAAAALGRHSAAARHLVWAATLAGVLALPVLRLVGPRWTPRSYMALARTADWMIARARPEVRTSVTAGGRASGASTGRRPTAMMPDGLAGVFLAGWALGTAVVLVRLAEGGRARRRAGRRAASCVPAAGGRPVEDALRSLAASLGVRRPVRLAWAPAGAVPMTWGVRRPVVLLPADAAAWPAPERDAVLRHELAHVRRGDAAWALVAELACAVCWFHPGVWRARAARLRWQERAADALAVASGAERHAYAATLVHIARRFVRAAGARRGLALTTALAHGGPGGGLAERVGALTTPAYVPGLCSGRRRTAILVGVAAAACAIAALGPLSRVVAIPAAAAAAAVQAASADGAHHARRVARPVTPSADGTRVSQPTVGEPVVGALTVGAPVARPPAVPAVPAVPAPRMHPTPVVRALATPTEPTPVAPPMSVEPTPPTPAIAAAESGPASPGTPLQRSTPAAPERVP